MQHSRSNAVAGAGYDRSRLHENLTLENRSVDIIHENFELAIRMGRSTDQNLIVRRIGFSQRILVASPNYLARRGPIRSRRAISEHDMIVTDASLLHIACTSAITTRGETAVIAFHTQ